MSFINFNLLINKIGLYQIFYGQKKKELENLLLLIEKFDRLYEVIFLDGKILMFFEILKSNSRNYFEISKFQLLKLF